MEQVLNKFFLNEQKQVNWAWWVGFTLFFPRALSPWKLQDANPQETEGSFVWGERKSISPLNGFLLFLNHVCQLLKDGAQLYNCRLNVLHGVCPTLDIGILQERESTGAQ
jgi:hypothetical protein